MSEKKYIFIMIFFVAIICFFTVGMSPLFDFYYFLHDASVYYIMGKGMKFGMVPYRDLFDHKGLYLYIINMLGSIIEYKHIGMYIITIIFTSLYGLYTYKTIKIFNEDNTVCLFTSIIMIFISRVPYFSNNSMNPEQYILTFIMLAIYLCVRYVKSDENKNIKSFAIKEGIVFSVVLFIKFNYCILFVPLMIYILLYLINNNKNDIIKAVIFSLYGIIIGAMPVLIYCIINNCFYDMIDAYFLLNFRYASHGFASYQLSKIEFFYRTIDKYKIVIITCVISFIMAIIVLIKNKIKNILCLYILFFIFGMYVVIMPLTALNYYTAVLVPLYLPLVYIMTNYIINIYKNNKLCNYVKVVFFILMIAILSYLFSYKIMINEKAVRRNNESKKMAKAIKNIKKNNDNLSVLMVGYCTYVYNEANILPGSKYFYIPTIYYEDKKELYDDIKNEIYTNKHNIVTIAYDQNYIVDVYGMDLVNYLNAKYTVVGSYGRSTMYKRKW